MQTFEIPDVEFLDTAQLAKILGVTRATVIRMRRAGRIPRAAYASNVTTLWAASDVRDWIQAGRPIDLELALDAGPDHCSGADADFEHDRELTAEQRATRDETPIEELPEVLRERVSQMRTLIDGLEMMLNSAPGMFVKQIDDMTVEQRRAQITGDNTKDDE